MNEYQKEMMQAPSVKSDLCVICGRPAQSQHHVIPRSQGGTNGPTMSVCGVGNESGCHGRIHAHLIHFSWSTILGWEYLITDEPMKYEKALREKGWMEVRTWE